VYYVKLSGEDLSNYSNKIESVTLRKCPYLSLSYSESDATISDVSQRATLWREKTARYGMKKLRHCHSMHRLHTCWELSYKRRRRRTYTVDKFTRRRRCGERMENGPEGTGCTDTEMKPRETVSMTITRQQSRAQMNQVATHRWA